MRVKLFNVNDGAVLRTFTGHTAEVRCLALLPDGRRFVSGARDAKAIIVEHGLAPAPAAPAYVAARKQVLRARVKDAEETIRQANAELADLERPAA